MPFCWIGYGGGWTCHRGWVQAKTCTLQGASHWVCSVDSMFEVYTVASMLEVYIVASLKVKVQMNTRELSRLFLRGLLLFGFVWEIHVLSSISLFSEKKPWAYIQEKALQILVNYALWHAWAQSWWKYQEQHKARSKHQNSWCLLLPKRKIGRSLVLLAMLNYFFFPLAKNFSWKGKAKNEIQKETQFMYTWFTCFDLCLDRRRSHNNRTKRTSLLVYEKSALSEWTLDKLLRRMWLSPESITKAPQCADQSGRTK